MGGAQAGIAEPPVPAAVSTGSGVGGGTSSWERRKKWAEYTHEASRRWQELFERLLKKEQELEEILQLRAVTKRREKRRKILQQQIARIEVQLEELKVVAEEEHLIMVLLLH